MVKQAVQLKNVWFFFICVVLPDEQFPNLAKHYLIDYYYFFSKLLKLPLSLPSCCPPPSCRHSRRHCCPPPPPPPTTITTTTTTTPRVNTSVGMKHEYNMVSCNKLWLHIIAA